MTATVTATPANQSITCTKLRMDSAGLHLTVSAEKHGKPLRIDLPMLGLHNADNALIAIAVARELGVPDDAIAGAMALAKGVEMRMELVRMGRAMDGDSDTKLIAQGSPALTPALSRGERGSEAGTGITVINDAYNANPDSMAAAVATLVSLPAHRRVAILADMLELGDAAASEHRQLGQRLLPFLRGGKSGIGLAILVGEAMGHAASEITSPSVAGSIVYVPRFSDDLPQRVAGMLRGGDLVLLKGSRGLKLERLLPAMRSRFGEAARQAAQTGK